MDRGMKSFWRAGLMASLAALAAASSGRAATVVQARSFDIATSFVAHPVTESGVSVLGVGTTDLTLESFARFDTGLGTLTGARLSLLATRSFRAGSSIFVAPGQNAAQLTMVGNAASSVLFGGSDLDPYSESTPPQFCPAYEGMPCLTLESFHRDEVVESSFADLGAFLLHPTVDFTLQSMAGAGLSILSGAGPYPTFTVAGELDWVGAATLTYSYDPFVVSPGVPEPADWTLLLVGFAGLGVALRRALLSARLGGETGAA
jgi:hypothetical protein